MAIAVMTIPEFLDDLHQLGHSSPVMTLRYGREGRAERSIRAFHELDQGVRQFRVR